MSAINLGRRNSSGWATAVRWRRGKQRGFAQVLFARGSGRFPRCWHTHQENRATWRTVPVRATKGVMALVGLDFTKLTLAATAFSVPKRGFRGRERQSLVNEISRTATTPAKALDNDPLCSAADRNNPSPE